VPARHRWHGRVASLVHPFWASQTLALRAVPSRFGAALVLAGGVIATGVDDDATGALAASLGSGAVAVRLQQLDAMRVSIAATIVGTRVDSLGAATGDFMVLCHTRWVRRWILVDLRARESKAKAADALSRIRGGYGLSARTGRPSM